MPSILFMLFTRVRSLVPAAVLAAALGGGAFLSVAPALAGGGFDPRVVTFGAAREQLQNTPITQRPNRPLHVYGNTVRRRHERTPAQRTSGTRPSPASSRR